MTPEVIEEAHSALSITRHMLSNQQGEVSGLRVIERHLVAILHVENQGHKWIGYIHHKDATVDDRDCYCLWCNAKRYPDEERP